MNRIYYNQADSRWAKHPYPSSSYKNATIKSGGCGPTSAAMIISSFKEKILPSQMGDIFRKNGYRAASGTSGNAFTFIARKWGLICNVKVKLDDAIACLKRGGMVVANVRGGSVFSTGGHYIVLAYMKDNNTIAVFDPYMYSNKFNTASRKNKVTVSGNTVFISYQNMKNYGLYSNLYCFEVPNAKTQNNNTNYAQGQAVEINAPFYFTNATEQDRFLYDNKTELCWIHADTKSLIKNDNLRARATICFVQKDTVGVQVFNDQFLIKKSEIVKKL